MMSASNSDAMAAEQTAVIAGVLQVSAVNR
jgi:hypothetical protein